MQQVTWPTGRQGWRCCSHQLRDCLRSLQTQNRNTKHTAKDTLICLCVVRALSSACGLQNWAALNANGFQLLALTQAMETVHNSSLECMVGAADPFQKHSFSVSSWGVFQDKMYIFFRWSSYDVKMSPSRGMWWNGHWSGVRNATQRHSI